MPSVEGRLSFLEGQVSEHARAFVDVRDTIRQFEHRMDSRFEAVDHRIEALDQTFSRRFEAVDQRFAAIDDKLSRQFVWTVGIQVTTLAAVVGAFITVVAAVITRP